MLISEVYKLLISNRLQFIDFTDFCYIFGITKRGNNNNRFIKVTFFKNFFNPIEFLASLQKCILNEGFNCSDVLIPIRVIENGFSLEILDREIY